MLIAWMLSPEDLGRIKTLQIFTDVSVIIAGGGLLAAISKMVPEAEDQEKRAYILQFAIKRTLIFSFLIFGIVNILSLLDLLSKESEVNNLFHTYSILIFPMASTLLFTRYFQSINEFKRISKIQLVTKLLTGMIIILGTYLFLIKGYIVSMLIGFMITCLYMLYDLREIVFNERYFKGKKILDKKILNLSKFYFLAQISDQFRMYISFFIANYVILERELFGQYSFALTILQGLFVFSSSVQQFLIPKMSKDSIDKNVFFKKLNGYIKKYFSICVLVFVLTQILAPPLLNFIFDNKYEAAMPLLRVLLIGWLIQSLFILIGPAFIGLGKMNYLFYISLITLIIITPVIILLSKEYGTLGIVWGYVFQNVINLFLMRYYLKKSKS